VQERRWVEVEGVRADSNPRLDVDHSSPRVLLVLHRHLFYGDQVNVQVGEEQVAEEGLSRAVADEDAEHFGELLSILLEDVTG